MPRTERKLHVHAAELSCQSPVLMLWIDDVDLRAATKRAHGDSREEIRLACSRVPEDPNVGVGVSALVEGVDEHGHAGRAIPSDHQPANLLNIGFVPGKEGRKCAGVDDAQASQTVRATGQAGKKTITHAERARLEVAEDGAGS